MHKRAIHRILARYRDEEPVELWRGKYAPTENQVMSYADEMSSDWDIFVQNPMHDREAVGRVMMLDTYYGMRLLGRPPAVAVTPVEPNDAVA